MAKNDYLTSLSRARRKTRRRAARLSPKTSWEEAEKRLRALLGSPKGSYWVCCEGSTTAPDRSHIPPWCEGVGGLRSELGSWHPALSLGNGRVLWKCLIYPKVQPTLLEQLAETTHEGEE
jgi:hypothetical protein